MDPQVQLLVEIVNRLKRCAEQGTLRWEVKDAQGTQFAVSLENGHSALVASVPGGDGVLFTMANDKGAQTLRLESSKVTDDVLKLALLQLFVTVRDSLRRHAAMEALHAVKNL